MIDLEDSIAESGKTEARTNAPAMIRQLADTGVPVFVRINDLRSRHWFDDLRAVTVPGLTGVGLSKTAGPEDIHVVSRVLDDLESKVGLPFGSVDVQPLLETAIGMHRAFETLSASTRIRSFFAGSARDGDIIRELGARWTPAGTETLYVRSKLLLDGRAARVPYPVTGTWTDITDREGLIAFANSGRDLGYTGMYVIHPSHVEPVNHVFTPTPEEIEYFAEVVSTLEDQENLGTGAVSLRGVMIDVAMAARARSLLEFARALGLAVPGP